MSAGLPLLKKGGVRAQLHMQLLIKNLHTLILTIGEVNLSKACACKRGHYQAWCENVHSA